MKPDVKAAWVAALRSGKYEQGLNRLRNDDNTYCCLGVLCDLAKEQGVLYWAKQELLDGEMSNWMAFPHTMESPGAGLLPLAVQTWAGLNTGNPTIGTSQASALNDVEGYNFNQIADLIEEFL